MLQESVLMLYYNFQNYLYLKSRAVFHTCIPDGKVISLMTSRTRTVARNKVVWLNPAIFSYFKEILMVLLVTPNHFVFLKFDERSTCQMQIKI